MPNSGQAACFYSQRPVPVVLRTPWRCVARGLAVWLGVRTPGQDMGTGHVSPCVPVCPGAFPAQRYRCLMGSGWAAAGEGSVAAALVPVSNCC